MIIKKTGYAKAHDGTSIYYEVRGEGPPLLMAYGIGCLINHWSPQIYYFSKNYQTIVFDYRGHHKSEIPKDRSNLQVKDLAHDIDSVLTELDLEQVHLMGHSFGTQVLLDFYKHSPQRVQSLVFINGFATNPIKGMFNNDIATQAFQLVKNGYKTLPDTSTYLWKNIVNNPLAVHITSLLGGFNIELTRLKDIEIYVRGVAAMDLDVFIRLFEAMMDYNGKPMFKKIECPTLIIGGKKDLVTPENHQVDMHHQIKKSQLLMIPYGSHCSQLDMPDFVNLRIDQFLDSFK